MSRATWIVPTTALAAGLGFSLFAAPANAAEPQNGWGEAARAVAQCEEIGGMGTHASGGFGDDARPGPGRAGVGNVAASFGVSVSDAGTFLLSLLPECTD